MASELPYEHVLNPVWRPALLLLPPPVSPPPSWSILQVTHEVLATRQSLAFTPYRVFLLFARPPFAFSRARLAPAHAGTTAFAAVVLPSLLQPRFHCIPFTHSARAVADSIPIACCGSVVLQVAAGITEASPFLLPAHRSQYQAVSYRLQGRMGTRDQLRSMIYACRRVGVRVYADAGPAPPHLRGVRLIKTTSIGFVVELPAAPNGDTFLPRFRAFPTSEWCSNSTLALPSALSSSSSPSLVPA